jgi:hypothetical protein
MAAKVKSTDNDPEQFFREKPFKPVKQGAASGDFSH